jgi:hypothetical protein
LLLPALRLLLARERRKEIFFFFSRAEQREPEVVGLIRHISWDDLNHRFTL